jgi:hypothetical protein
MRKTPLNSARRRNPVDGMDKLQASPPRPQQNRSRRSGHRMRCQNRTTSFAIDSVASTTLGCVSEKGSKSLQLSGKERCVKWAKFLLMTTWQGVIAVTSRWAFPIQVHTTPIGVLYSRAMQTKTWCFSSLLVQLRTSADETNYTQRNTNMIKKTLIASVAALALSACSPSHAQEKTVDFSIALTCDQLEGLDHREIKTTIYEYEQMPGLFAIKRGQTVRDAANLKDPKRCPYCMVPDPDGLAAIRRMMQDWSTSVGVKDFGTAVYSFNHGV